MNILQRMDEGNKYPADYKFPTQVSFTGWSGETSILYDLKPPKIQFYLDTRPEYNLLLKSKYERKGAPKVIIVIWDRKTTKPILAKFMNLFEAKKLLEFPPENTSVYLWFVDYFGNSILDI